jgi:putative FmdB family regulatory protein
MPIYEYTCRACGHELEKLQKLSDPAPTDCPGCGKPALARKMSAPSFRLKGGGWYETDFKSDKDKKRNLVDSGKTEGGTENQPSAKSETKPDTKSEAKVAVKTEAKPESKATPKITETKAKPASSSGKAGTS